MVSIDQVGLHATNGSIDYEESLWRGFKNLLPLETVSGPVNIAVPDYAPIGIYILTINAFFVDSLKGSGQVEVEVQP